MLKYIFGFLVFIIFFWIFTIYRKKQFYKKKPEGSLCIKCKREIFGKPEICPHCSSPQTFWGLYIREISLFFPLFIATVSSLTLGSSGIYIVLSINS